MAISEDEVKRSFSRVKEDILQVKRSLNKQLFSIDELKKSLGGSLGKEEFYAFVKRLGSRIEQIEDSFGLKPGKDELVELSSELHDELAKLKQVVDRRDELADEIRSVRALKGKVLEIESAIVPKPEFSKEVVKLNGEIARLKSAEGSSSSELSSLSDSVSKLNKDVAELGGSLKSLSTNAVVKEEISSFTDRIESSHREVSRAFASLKRDVDKRVSMLDSVDERLSSLSEKLASAESAISSLASGVSRKYAEKSSVEKSISELKSQLDDTRKLLESSMSEVSFDDYVTKRSLKQQLSSVSESLASGISSRLVQVEEQLAAMRGNADSMQKSFEKRLEKELQKVGDDKELRKLRDEIGKLDSKFMSADEFYPKLERLESSTVQASDDFRKELKKQRELFEERLKSLESHYRSSNDFLKAELDDVKGQLKGLSKADEKAKVEMARITVTAAKAAAKSAADILEEVEKESPKERSEHRKGVSPLAVSLIILVFLVVGSVAYVMLKGGGEAPVNETSLVIPVVPPVEPVEPEESPGQAPGVSTEPVQPAPNETSPGPSGVSEPPSSPPENVTPSTPPPAENATNVTFVPVDNDAECKRQLECTPRSGGEYWFDCYFDDASQECRCFVGSIKDCPQFMVENESAVNASASGEAVHEEEGRKFSARYYGIVAFIIAAVAFLAYRALFVRDENEEDKESATEHKEEKPGKDKPKEKKEKASVAEKEEQPGQGEDVIDLEEFFEKKDKKK